MKGSAVAQGLKSITDKLHPQLPLTSRESQQLLTALTTSFRRHLDEAHPGNTDDSGQKQAAGANAHASIRTLKSSAAYTDRHLASVLTNPLLARAPVGRGPRYDYDVIRTALTQNPSRDPISLFEACEKKGTATVAIAKLCLDALKQSLDALTPENRIAQIKDVEPGRRFFLWLLRGQYHVSPALVDNSRLVDLLCYFLYREGREDVVWEWLRLDVTAKDTEALSFKTDAKLKLHQYRWRNRVINALVRTKLGLLEHDSGKLSLEATHAAIDVYLAAFKMQLTAQPGHHLRWFSLTAAAWTLRTALVSQFPGRSQLDVIKYDDFSRSIPAISPVTITSQSYVAALQLRHPTRPSTDLAWVIAKSLLVPTPSKDGQKVLCSIKSDESHPRSRYWYSFLVSTAHCLATENRVNDASWIKSRIMEEFPSLSTKLEMDLRVQYHSDPFPAQKQVIRDVRSKDAPEIHAGAFLPSFG